MKPEYYFMLKMARPCRQGSFGNACEEWAEAVIFQVGAFS